MTIRSRLIVQTVLLQLISLLLLGYGFIYVQRSLYEKDIVNAELLLKHAVARTATDALIQSDEVQLLSYLNFLKVQYPALSWARVVWRKGPRSSVHELKGASAGRVEERRVMVPDPGGAARSIEVFYGVDQDVLRAPLEESRKRKMRVLLLVMAGTALLGLGAAVLMARSLTRRVSALASMAEQISEGRLGVSLEWESDDELGSLARTFNAMSSRLAELDTAKRNFVSAVSHELRSPLGAIESFLPLIRDKVKAGDAAALEQAHLFMDRVQANVHRLNRYITDLLDVAKIEQGKMECVLRPIRVENVAGDVAEFFSAKAAAQGVTVENRIDQAPVVRGDADRVRQVLVNLVSNSLKFTPSGGQVWIEARRTSEAGEPWLEVAVGDTGRGMGEADKGRLFKPFSQGRNVHEGVNGNRGTGLGLYIVKSIVEQHGGKVGLSSAPGQGTRVSFTLRVENKF